MNEAAKTSQTSQKLPVFKIVAETYRSFFHNLRYLPQAALVPALLSVPLFWAHWNLHLQAVVDPTRVVESVALLFASYLAYLVIFVLFCVSWYRLILLGPATARPPALPFPRRRHWRAFGYILLTLLLYLVATVIGVLALGSPANFETANTEGAESITTSLLQALWGLGAVAFTAYIALRLSFVFPAASVDEDYALRDSWRHTKGHTLRLFAVIFLVSLPSFLVLVVFSVTTNPAFEIPAGGTAAMDPAQLATEIENFFLFRAPIGNLLGLCSWAILIGAVAIAFKSVTGWYPGATNDPADV